LIYIKTEHDSTLESYKPRSVSKSQKRITMSNSIMKSWNKKSIRFREDGYGCLTDMATAAGKLVGGWLRLKSTNEYLQALAGSMRIHIDDLITTKSSDYPSEERGTWGHPEVCTEFAGWCNAPIYKTHF
jgi:hypothetical protein